MSKRMIRKEAQQMLCCAGDELKDLRRQINGAYAVFNRTLDQDKLEASILEINALQSKYGIALKSFKSIQINQ